MDAHSFVARNVAHLYAVGGRQHNSMDAVAEMQRTNIAAHALRLYWWKIPQTQVLQGFAAFRLILSRIPPRHSQTTHRLIFVHTAQEPTANFCRIDGPNCVARATIRC